jgi:hypothetical protein
MLNLNITDDQLAMAWALGVDGIVKRHSGDPGEMIDWWEDIVELKTYLQGQGLTVSHLEAYCLWFEYSQEMDAGWMTMTPDAALPLVTEILKRGSDWMPWGK